MQKIATLLITAAAALAIAGCSSSGANPVVVPNVANVASNVLQLNVGTANLFGDVPAAHIVGTNVTVTYRQPAGALNPGASATLVNSPTLTVPAALGGVPGAGAGNGGLSAILSGPARGEIGTKTMTSTAQTPNASTITTFGVDGGASGLGLEPFNYGVNGVPYDSVINPANGAPIGIEPYPVPLYDALAPDPNAFMPLGGLPAFNPAGNAANAAANGAISEGLDVFELAPAVGTYGLSVSVPGNTGTVTATASAAISTVVTLPPFVAPVPVLVGSTGGATLAVVMPAGVTEAYIQVTDFGPTFLTGTGGTQGASCLMSTNPTGGISATNPMYYTIVIKATGTATLPAGSLCTAAQNTTANGSTPTDGDAFTVQAIGFDYGAYEASYPNSLGVTSPSLAGAGASHQADVTVSSQGVYNQPVGGGALINGAGGAALPAGTLRARGSSLTRR